MIIVIVNGDFLATKTFAGVGRFATETMKELDRISSNEIIFEIVCPEYADRRIELKNIKIIKKGNENLLLWKQWTLPRYVKQRKGVLLDFTQAFPVSIQSFSYIHDCIPELFPRAYESILKKLFRRPLKLLQRKRIAKKSLRIFTLTENSKKDILHFYSISENKIVVTYTGWEHIRDTKADEHIFEKLKGVVPGNYCFTLGSRVWHKNIKWVICAAEQNPEYVFVVSGDNSFMVDFEKQKSTMPSNVVFTGYISDGEVRALMANCKAFLFPTLYEGFGMPPLEAMSVGAPIIISSTSCLPEIYEESAHYIDPLKYENINIDEILSSQVESGEKIMQKYSWEKTAEIIFKTIYQYYNYM